MSRETDLAQIRQAVRQLCDQYGEDPIKREHMQANNEIYIRTERSAVPVFNSSTAPLARVSWQNML
jgi:hypothetical protein